MPGLNHLVRLTQCAAAVLLACACGSDGKPLDALAVASVPHFTVRGRLPSTPSLRVHINGADSPLEEGVFENCLRTAMATWNATGLVEFVEASGPASSDLLCGWRRRSHDECPAFGQDTSVAHAGPVSMQTFIHFDAGRVWSSTDAEGLPLSQVALHELGHVLGLGHSLDESAVMHANYDPRRNLPTLSDLAGLASLYGKLDADARDLWVDSPAGTRHTLLYRVAPLDKTGFGISDVTGNGRDELLVWRTDQAGSGRLMVYHFDGDRQLERTSGPMLDCVLPGATVVLGQDTAGDPVLLSVLSSGRFSARRFQQNVFPRPLAPGASLAMQAGYADLDGDGVLDVFPAVDENVQEPKVKAGDLDGDGIQERVGAGS
ncbi:MAG: hypothetical protein ACI9F9_003041 [Candidatus Paceibacteria bacterium]|jgi:hypothetical protein